MDKIIAACGNDCARCPRHMPKTDAELNKTAELWYRIGYRDKIVSNEEIQCFGCTADHWCRYKIAKCAETHEVENCGQCIHYPCSKIQSAFEQTMQFEPNCGKACSAEEYDALRQAFFEKKRNLDSIAGPAK